MKLNIPSIGDKLILASDWKFTIHMEYRNRSLLEVMVPEEWKNAKYSRYGESVCECTLPKGIELTIERIYIRKGMKEFDSVTFRAKDPNKTKSKSYRFWVKLVEANRIDYEENVPSSSN
jgi:hypothetical protein